MNSDHCTKGHLCSCCVISGLASVIVTLFLVAQLGGFSRGQCPMTMPCPQQCCSQSCCKCSSCDCCSACPGKDGCCDDGTCPIPDDSTGEKGD